MGNLLAWQVHKCQGDVAKGTQQTFSGRTVGLSIGIAFVETSQLLIVCLEFSTNDKLDEGQEAQGERK